MPTKSARGSVDGGGFAFTSCASGEFAPKTAADADPTVLRISMDAKATLKVGDFSRGGKKDVQVKAANHDFKAKVTPVGILLPERDELFLACVTSKVTSDRSHMILSNIVDIQQS